jgi:hypothetical protein
VITGGLNVIAHRLTSPSISSPGPYTPPPFSQQLLSLPPRSFPSSGRTSNDRRSSSTESLQADPPPRPAYSLDECHAALTQNSPCTALPITQKTCWARSPASYTVSFSHLVLKTLMARTPCQEGTLCISPCDVVKRWRRAPPPKKSARAPSPDLDSAMADLRHPSAKSQPLLLCNHLPHHPSGEDNGRAWDQAEQLGGMARPAVILPTRWRDLSPTVSTHLSTRS